MGQDIRESEIVGLHSFTFRRSCKWHEVCGHVVEVGSIVWFKWDVLYVSRDRGLEDGEDAADLVPETVVKVVLIEGGSESCTVGFLPRHIAMRPAKVLHLQGQCAQVIE